MRVLALFLVCASALGAPVVLQHQGRLLAPTGEPYVGTVQVTHTLFDDATATGPTHLLWSDTATLVAEGGYFARTLGTDADPLDSAWFSDPVWLEIAVGGQVLGPRQRVSESWVRGAGGISVEGLPSSESCSEAGAVVYDTELRTLRVCDGSAWQVAGALTPLDLTPDPFDFLDVSGAVPSAVVTSNPVTVTGYSGARTATVAPADATFVVDGSPTGSSAVSVVAGQTLAVRATAPSGYTTSAAYTVTFGGQSDDWSVTTHGPCTSGSTSFSTAGVFDFDVPNGCTHLTVALWGGGGGSGAGTSSSGCAGHGANGAYVTGVVDVVSGEPLVVVVGGGGTGATYAAGGGGGGHTSILRGTLALASAGGGGGGGANNATAGGTATTSVPMSGYGAGAAGCKDSHPSGGCGTSGSTTSFAGGVGAGGGGNGGIGGGGGGGYGGNCGGGGGGGGYPGGTAASNQGGAGGGSIVPSGGTHIQGGAPGALSGVGAAGLNPRSGSYGSNPGTAGRVELSWAP